MGFLKNVFTNIFGGGQRKPAKKQPQRPNRSRPFGVRQQPLSVDEHLAGALLEEIGNDEDDIRRGKVMQVVSSNVTSFRWLPGEDAMEIEFHDGSLYRYDEIPLTMALEMYRAGSKGKWVWDRLRVRGTVFGWQKPYTFLDGPSRAKRIWHELGPESRRQHGLIPKSGALGGFAPFAHQIGGLGKRRGSGARKPKRSRGGTPFKGTP